MSRKTPLTSQTRKLNIVIRKNKEIPLHLIKQYCDENFEKYAFIEHKNHILPSNGEIEGVHYHICGDAIGTGVALSTRLNTIVKFFNFENSNGIEIEKYNTLEGSIQYLTHKNQPDKTQEPKEKIIHNFDKNDFEILYNAEIGNVITYELLYVSCVSANNIIDVIKDLGIGNYKNWRSVIWDIWNSLKDKEDFRK